jgi:hypothetical protein
MIRQTRGNTKPIRIFLQDGENDINLTQGSWTLGNINMESALMFARYDYDFEMGTGAHDTRHGGAILPDTLRWIWRDYPGVKRKNIGNEGKRSIFPPCYAGLNVIADRLCGSNFSTSSGFVVGNAVST